ncbi:M48 family metallopeptidase [Marinobacter sp. ELB17]|uniref:M48 metallopeptidase family protein n=1 Tax=Marinobacter sp. ELB17 TaxID=270374 RepID=UPI0000F3754B|nr:M48 family metallopeptidase [Marinobacter sp. ELB17]EBA00670.1 putative predicted metal-dependent hydrolase [Marinobacter sp. ELB17]
MLGTQTQWGSCSPEGTALLNPDLIKATTQAIDYVLLHELYHLVEHNHSPRFYGLLDRFMPEWRLVKEQLDGGWSCFCFCLCLCL